MEMVETKHREPNAMRPNMGANNRAAMAEGCGPAACPVALLDDFSERVIGFDALYESARKCALGVAWKYSTKNYMLHLVENTAKLEEDLKRGKYREGRTRAVHITYPKPREAVSIPFRDRVFQRSLNDNSLYPAMTRSFIWANFACQRGKGTDAARDYFKAMLRRAFIEYGTNSFPILSGDIRKYYDSMRHDIVNAMFARRLDAWSAAWVKRTLDRQYKGDIGYNPGSQMVQIAGISYLDTFDHFVKERLRRRYYLRYMDDWHVCGRDSSELEKVREAAERKLAEVGLALHPTKTRIRNASDGVVFLGFLFRVTTTGKVLMLRDPRRVKEIKRRLRRLARKEARGGVPPGTTAESYRCVRACFEKGNSRKALRGMDDFYNSLKGDQE